MGLTDSQSHQTNRDTPLFQAQWYEGETAHTYTCGRLPRIGAYLQGTVHQRDRTSSSLRSQTELQKSTILMTQKESLMIHQMNQKLERTSDERGKGFGGTTQIQSQSWRKERTEDKIKKSKSGEREKRGFDGEQRSQRDRRRMVTRLFEKQNWIRVLFGESKIFLQVVVW